MLRTIHESPVAALDTGTTSVAGLAEQYLDEWDKAIQTEGWAENIEYDVDCDGVDVTKLTVSMTTGAWTAATRTLTKSGAFTSYTWAHGDQLYVSGGTGVTVGWYQIQSKTSANAIVLVKSIATADNTDTATTLIGWDDAIAIPTDILAMDGYDADDDEDVVMRGGYLFDKGDDTFTFSDGITVQQVRQLTFANLSELLQRYIIAGASIEFQRRMTQGQVEDNFLQSEYSEAKRKLFKSEAEQDDANVLETEHAHRILGTGLAYNQYRYR